MVGVTPVAPGRRLRSSARAVAPQAYFVGSAVFHYLGPSFAVLLFARVDVLGVAWLWIVSAAIVFAIWRRPWRKFASLDRDGQLLIVAVAALQLNVTSEFGGESEKALLWTVWPEKSRVSPEEGTAEVSFITLLNQM